MRGGLRVRRRNRKAARRIYILGNFHAMKDISNGLVKYHQLGYPSIRTGMMNFCSFI